MKIRTIEQKIKQITVVTSQGVCTYTAGQQHPFLEAVINQIVIIGLRFTGDPFDHYVGLDKEDNILFSIYPLTPCVVDYFI